MMVTMTANGETENNREVRRDQLIEKKEFSASLNTSTQTMKSLILVTFLLMTWITITYPKKFKEGEKPEWAKKDIRDYTEADLERLYDQWEQDETEDPLEPDELPEHLRPAPPIDLSKLDTSDPESILRLSKKGKTVMSFVSVSGSPTKTETEEITGIWQTSLHNSHLPAERFVVGEDRAIFMFKDGSHAWEAKDFLIQQDRCKDVTIENKVYDGKGKTKDEL